MQIADSYFYPNTAPNYSFFSKLIWAHVLIYLDIHAGIDLLPDIVGFLLLLVPYLLHHVRESASLPFWMMSVTVQLIAIIGLLLYFHGNEKGFAHGL